MAKKNGVEQEYSRLAELYKDIPENKRKLVEGLLEQAAKLRVSLNDLWEQIQEVGRFEEWTKAGETYTRENDISKAWTNLDRSYQAIIRQLNDNLPAKEKASGFSKLGDDDD